MARAWRHKKGRYNLDSEFFGRYLYVNEKVDQVYVKTGDIIEFGTEWNRV